MQSRFENHLSGQALVLREPRDRIVARRPQDLPAAFAAIEEARRQGRWLALLLDYELGEWLLPEACLAPPDGPPATPRPDDAPRLTALVFDAAERQAIIAPGSTGPAAGWPGEDADRHVPAAPDPPPSVQSVSPRLARDAYIAHIEQIRGCIAAGEFYQLNYTHPLDVAVRGDPVALYRDIAARHPAAHAACIDDGERLVLSFSPELFVAREGARLVTRPMKGTAPRHSDPAEDRRLGQALQASPKDRAENLMITDLLRNDLGRLARTGSVRVEALFTLERYPSVWTLTSTISAEAPAATLEDVLRALFPCGSVTGAPKVAAMRRIRQLEAWPRGLYCGSVGWLAPSGDFSLNVAIRTLVLPSGHAASRHGVYHVGGGIVHDSNPGQEWQECHWKARILR